MLVNHRLVDDCHPGCMVALISVTPIGGLVIVLIVQAVGVSHRSIFCTSCAAGPIAWPPIVYDGSDVAGTIPPQDSASQTNQPKLYETTHRIHIASRQNDNDDEACRACGDHDEDSLATPLVICMTIAMTSPPS